MTFITDKVLTARQFVEYYSGEYFMNCDTFAEAKSCLASKSIFIGNGLKLTELAKEMREDYPCVLVEFSDPDDYTAYEYRVVRLQKKYLHRFITNMKAVEVSSS